MTLTFILFMALALDHTLGEPDNSHHPLVFFGSWANYLEKSCTNSLLSPHKQKILGCLALVCALLPGMIGLAEQYLPPTLQSVFGIIVLYFCIGAQSLKQHALAVHDALLQQNLPLARQQVARIVSRQTESMSIQDVRRATIESVLENGADAIFAPVFWFIILGPFGALLYRLSNTLDAMWGYKNDRYQYFGWAAARFDDLLNWIPARLTAISYALLGNTLQALKAWRNGAHRLESPNGGPVMTSGAGSLSLQLGGPAYYHGVIKPKPWFGGKNQPENHDILLVCNLINRTLVLWFFAVALGDSIA